MQGRADQMPPELGANGEPWLIWLVLVGLLVELAMLAWPHLKQPNSKPGVKA